MRHASIEGTTALMKHHRTAVVLATGGAGMVRAAYSSGKPTLAVGPGNGCSPEHERPAGDP